MSTELSIVLERVRRRSTIGRSLIHGEEHWRRVSTLGLDIAEADPAVDPLVIVLFGLCHDAMRLNDGSDPEHGRRSAAVARSLLPGLIKLSAVQLDVFESACAYHSEGRTTDNPTIGACWDADRLDLCRLAIVPNPAKMSTVIGRRQETLWRARALLGRAPEWAAIFDRLAAMPASTG